MVAGGAGGAHGDAWRYVEVYEAGSGERRWGKPNLQIETVLEALGVPALWSRTDRRFPLGRFAVALKEPEGASAADGGRGLLRMREGPLGDGSGLAYRVAGEVADTALPHENRVYAYVPGEDNPGGVRRRVLGILEAAERRCLPDPPLSEGRMRCPYCGRSEGFVAYESYVHKLSLDEDGDAVDDNLGAGSDGVRLSTSCDACGHEWREDAGDPSASEPVVRAALELALGALEHAAHSAMGADRVGGDAGDYWADGGEGDRAIEGVREGIRALGGRAALAGEAGGEAGADEGGNR